MICFPAGLLANEPARHTQERTNAALHSGERHISTERTHTYTVVVAVIDRFRWRGSESTSSPVLSDIRTRLDPLIAAGLPRVVAASLPSRWQLSRGVAAAGSLGGKGRRAALACSGRRDYHTLPPCYSYCQGEIERRRTVRIFLERRCPRDSLPEKGTGGGVGKAGDRPQ